MATYVRDLMTQDVTVVSPESTLREVAEVLTREGITGAPVVGAGGGLLGVVSASDLVDFMAVAPGAPTEAAENAGDAAWSRDYDTADDGADPWFLDPWADSGADVLEHWGRTQGPEWNVLEQHTASEAMTREVIATRPDATLREAAGLMLDNGVHRALVLDDGILCGVLTTMDLVRHLAAPEPVRASVVRPARSLATMRVRDLMRRDVVTIAADASIRELVRLLRTQRVSAVPVVEGRRAVGMVSSTDLLWLLDPESGDTIEHALDGRVVREIMTPDVFAIEPAATLLDLRQFFTRTAVRRALVVQADEIVGIVTVTDVLDLIDA